MQNLKDSYATVQRKNKVLLSTEGLKRDCILSMKHRAPLIGMPLYHILHMNMYYNVTNPPNAFGV